MNMDSEQASLLSSIASPFQLMLPLLIPYLDKLILYRTIFGISMLISSIMPLLYPLLCETIHLPTAVVFVLLADGPGYVFLRDLLYHRESLLDDADDEVV